MARRHLEEDSMSVLRIRCSLLDPTMQCEWALIDGAVAPTRGKGGVARLPRRARRVQFVIPAAQVLITRAQLPPAARRRAGSLLAFAVEDETLGEPEANQAIWLGSVAGADVLAVIDKQGLNRWADALNAIGMEAYEVHCETLLLPWAPGEWSLAWDGREGFVKSGEYEGTATDCGDEKAPPLSLRLALEAAAARRVRPDSIAMYLIGPNAAPDLGAWQRELGIALRLAGQWDWGTAPPNAGNSLMQQRRSWRGPSQMLARLRPAAWIVGAALAIHALALIADWTMLAAEQRSLRGQMEARFRAALPDAVAVVDPTLQMRRKLAEARHAAGQPDSGDFLPMIANMSAALQGLPTAGLRVGSYENGRLTLEFAALEEDAMRRVVAHLLQAGLSVDAPTTTTRLGSSTRVITVRTQ